jgi:hypothetical protein
MRNHRLYYSNQNVISNEVRGEIFYNMHVSEYGVKDFSSHSALSIPPLIEMTVGDLINNLLTSNPPPQHPGTLFYQTQKPFLQLYS